MEISKFIDFPDIKDYIFDNHTKVGETIFAFMKRFYENIILADMNNVYMCLTHDIYHYINKLYGIGISFIETHSYISNKTCYIPNMDEYPIYMGDYLTHRYIEHIEHCGIDRFVTKSAHNGMSMLQRIPLIHTSYIESSDDKIDLIFHVMYHYNNDIGIGWERYNRWMAFQETLLFLQAVHDIKNYPADDKYIKEEELYDIIHAPPF